MNFDPRHGDLHMAGFVQRQEELKATDGKFLHLWVHRNCNSENLKVIFSEHLRVCYASWLQSYSRFWIQSIITEYSLAFCCFKLQSLQVQTEKQERIKSQTFSSMTRIWGFKWELGENHQHTVRPAFTLCSCELRPVGFLKLGKQFGLQQQQQQQQLCISIRWISSVIVCWVRIWSCGTKCIFVLCRLLYPSHHPLSAPFYIRQCFAGWRERRSEETLLMFNEALHFKVVRCRISRGRRLL